MSGVDGAMQQEIEQLLMGSDPLQNLSLAHTGGTTYLCLDSRDGSLTAYNVDLNRPSCTCPAHDPDGDDGKVCRHIALAAMDHPERMDVETETVSHLFRQVHELNQAVSALQGVAADMDGGMVSREPRTADQTEPETAAGQGQAGQPVEETKPTVDPLAAVEEWLESRFAQPEKVRTERGDHGGTEGVRLSPQNQEMDDPVYESFKSLVNGVDGSTVHVGFTDEGCQTCNSGDSGFWYHIPSETAQELI